MNSKIGNISVLYDLSMSAVLHSVKAVIACAYQFVYWVWTLEVINHF